MTKYKDIYSVVVFAIVVHTALTASLVNIFMTLSYVQSEATGTGKTIFQYGGSADLGVVVRAEDSTSAGDDSSISDFVVGNIFDTDLSLENYSAPTALDDDEVNAELNKAKTVRYMMW